MLDLLHYQHVNIFKRVKDQGNFLIVALFTNEFNDIKSKKCYFSYEERRQLVEAIRYVEQAMPENNWKHKIKYIK